MIASELVSACESAWKSIQKTHPQVPDAIILISSGGRRAQTLYGYFTKETWERAGEPVHEVVLVAEQLLRGSEQVFNTILHESVHALAVARDIKEVSGKRHNKKFARLSEEMGMIAPEKPDSKLGFSDVKLTDEALAHYKEDIAQITEALKLFRKLQLTDKKSKKTTWVAGCDCGRKIRVGKKLFENDPTHILVDCSVCGSEFKIEDYDE